jgi:hypothetical protein
MRAENLNNAEGLRLFNIARMNITVMPLVNPFLHVLKDANVNPDVFLQRKLLRSSEKRNP